MNIKYIYYIMLICFISLAFTDYFNDHNLPSAGRYLAVSIYTLYLLRKEYKKQKQSNTTNRQ